MLSTWDSLIAIQSFMCTKCDRSSLFQGKVYDDDSGSEKRTAIIHIRYADLSYSFFYQQSLVEISFKKISVLNAIARNAISFQIKARPRQKESEYGVISDIISF